MQGNYRLMRVNIAAADGELNVPAGWRVKQVMDLRYEPRVSYDRDPDGAYVLIERIER